MMLCSPAAIIARLVIKQYDSLPPRHGGAWAGGGARLRLPQSSPRVSILSTMMKRLDHLGIAVASMDDAKRLFIDTLGMTLINEGSSAEFGVRFARVTPPSGPTIELLEYLDKSAPVDTLNMLDHVAFAVDELDSAVVTLQTKGIELDRCEPTMTVRPGGVDRSTTTLPKSTFGIRVQLV